MYTAELVEEISCGLSPIWRGVAVRAYEAIIKGLQVSSAGDPICGRELRRILRESPPVYLVSRPPVCFPSRTLIKQRDWLHEVEVLATNADAGIYWLELEEEGTIETPAGEGIWIQCEWGYFEPVPEPGQRAPRHTLGLKRYLVIPTSDKNLLFVRDPDTLPSVPTAADL